MGKGTAMPESEKRAEGAEGSGTARKKPEADALQKRMKELHRG
jgi:hypothetical protein